MNNYLEKFKKFTQSLDDPKPLNIPVILDTGVHKRFNVHKRSLPVGIDRIVIFGVSRSEGELIISKMLKVKLYHDDMKESKTIIYYDLIPEDATPKERSIYYNNSKLML